MISTNRNITSQFYYRRGLRENINTVLVPGMIVSMEPKIMLPEGLPRAGRYREHDILVITEAGTETITKFPFGPDHNIVRP